MAMIDDGLFGAPQGLPEDEGLTLEQLLADEQEATPDDVDVELVEDADGGATLSFGEDEIAGPEAGFDSNLAEMLPEEELGRISSEIRGSYEDDRASRADWEKQYTDGLALLGLTYENRTEPFMGATGVVHPLLNEAVTQFQAGAYKELLPSSGPARS